MGCGLFGTPKGVGRWVSFFVLVYVCTLCGVSHFTAWAALKSPSTAYPIEQFWLSLIDNGELFECPSYRQTTRFLNDVMETYPHLLSRFTIGMSYEKRVIYGYRLHDVASPSSCVLTPLESNVSLDRIFDHDRNQCVANVSDDDKGSQLTTLVRRLTGLDTPESKPVRDCSRILITALHHAREVASLTTLLYFLYYTILHSEHKEDVVKRSLARYLLQHRDIILVPFVNPDGFLAIQKTHFKYMRKNRRPTCNISSLSSGVDLNRNYGYMFKSTREGCDFEEYEGKHPFSEPETQAIRCLTHSLKFLSCINFHAFGGLWAKPFNCCKNKRLHEAIETVYKDISKSLKGQQMISSPEASELLYEASGEADDWMLHDRGIIAMSAEVDGKAAEFWPPRSTLTRISSFNIEPTLSVIMKTGTVFHLESTKIANTSLYHFFLFNKGIAPVGYETTAVAVFVGKKLELHKSTKPILIDVVFLRKRLAPQQRLMIPSLHISEEEYKNVVFCVINTLEMFYSASRYCHCGLWQSHEIELTPLAATTPLCKEAFAILFSNGHSISTLRLSHFRNSNIIYLLELFLLVFFFISYCFILSMNPKENEASWYTRCAMLTTMFVSSLLCCFPCLQKVSRRLRASIGNSNVSSNRLPLSLERRSPSTDEELVYSLN